MWPHCQPCLLQALLKSNPQLPLWAPPQTPVQAPVSMTQIPHWHASMSPNAYKVVLTPIKVKKCYGCGCDFADKYGSSPSNLIIKHVIGESPDKMNEQVNLRTAAISQIYITTQ